jgi:hypothetical protein
MLIFCSHLPGACILTGVIDADEYWPSEGSVFALSRPIAFCHLIVSFTGWKTMAICFTALGSITFIPGFYVTKIA